MVQLRQIHRTFCQNFRRSQILWKRGSGIWTKERRRKKIENAIGKLEQLSPKLNAYHLKTKKEIKAAIDGICQEIKGLIDVKILTERKQVRVKVSPGRPSLESVYKNKWEFTYGIQWKLNEQTIAETSKTDGIFPLITNTKLEASEVLRNWGIYLTQVATTYSIRVDGARNLPKISDGIRGAICLPRRLPQVPG